MLRVEDWAEIGRFDVISGCDTAIMVEPGGLGQPSAAALEVVTEAGERSIMVALEQPEVVWSLPAPLEKRVLERLHLERFRFDSLVSSGQTPFEDVRTGENPPDFRVVRLDGTRLGVDVVSMALESRRSGHALFRRFLEKVAGGAEGRDLSNLAGTTVSVWFGEDLAGPPPKVADDRLIEPLLDALSSAHVDHESSLELGGRISAEGFPAQMPPSVLCTGTTPDGLAGFVANVVCMPQDAAHVFGGPQFAMSLHMPMQISVKEATNEQLRRIREHDKPEIDQLLLTAGEPDRNGFRYPAEELVVTSLLSESDAVIQVRHIQGIWLHLWGAGASVDLPLSPL